MGQKSSNSFLRTILMAFGSFFEESWRLATEKKTPASLATDPAIARGQGVTSRRSSSTKLVLHLQQKFRTEVYPESIGSRQIYGGNSTLARPLRNQRCRCNTIFVVQNICCRCNTSFVLGKCATPGLLLRAETAASGIVAAIGVQTGSAGRILLSLGRQTSG